MIIAEHVLTAWTVNGGGNVASGMKGADQTRERIHKAAFEQMQRVGHAGLRTQDVASRAGVSHGLLFYHFGQRTPLVTSTLAWATDHYLREAVRAAEMAGSPNASPPPVWLGMLALVRSGYVALLFELTAGSHTEPLLQKAIHEAWEKLYEHIEGFLPASSRSALPAELTRTLITGLLFEMQRAHRHRPLQTHPDLRFQPSLQLLLAHETFSTDRPKTSRVAVRERSWLPKGWSGQGGW